MRLTAPGAFAFALTTYSAAVCTAQATMVLLDEARARPVPQALKERIAGAVERFLRRNGQGKPAFGC